MNQGSARRVERLCQAAAILLGILNAWTSRHAARSDTISYLDLASALLGGDFQALLNPYWSPLYPVLLSLLLGLVNPSPYWEFAVVHLTDLLIYLAALASFQFLLRQWIHSNRLRAEALASQSRALLPQWTWAPLGYGLFLWSSLVLIWRSPGGTPDLLVAAVTYLAAGLVLRIGVGAASLATFAALGLTLGLGCLAKAAVLPLAPVFLLTAGLAVHGRRGALSGMAIAATVFLVISGAYVAALSRSRQRLTFGDAGRLNYVWFVNGVVPFSYWQGGPPEAGIPRHPLRLTAGPPPIFEFAGPVPGTFPPWYDPAYWNEGLRVGFSPARQLRAVFANARIYFLLFWRQGGLLVGWITLMLLSTGGWRDRLDLRGPVMLLAPAAAALAMYSLVHVEWRYVGAFVVLLWLGLFSAVRLPESEETRRTAGRLAVAMVVLLGVEVLGLGVYGMASTSRSLAHHPHWQVAAALGRLGVRPGDTVAIIGSGGDAYWARLARVRIVASIPPAGADYFWASGEAVRRQSLDHFARAGARAVVAEHVPAWAPTTDWRRLLERGDHWARRLPQPSGSP